MVRCGACGTDNPAGFAFCGNCAAPLQAVTCGSCGALLAADQRFCGRCGTPAGATEPATAGAVAVRHERRLATVLFADVVGFTTLAEAADPEAVAASVSASFAHLAEIIDEHGGTVDKYMGDSLMAVFGVPSAHDDDAERAVAAALAIRDVEGELTFSIGINTGEVMATTMPGDDGRLTVIGDTVNVAARLEKAAGAGEVLVGPLTRELAGDRVVFREREAMLLKGKSDAVCAFEAVSLRDSAPEPNPQRPPLIGREDELAFLVSRWRRCVRDRRSELVLLVGEVGAGKSRLLEELVAQAADARVVTSTVPAYGALSGARTAGDVLRQLGRTGDEHLDARLESLAGGVVPQLAALDAAALEREQLRAFRHLIEARAAERPLLIMIDEAQRSNERSLRFLAELAVRVEGPVLLVLAGRPEPAEWLQRTTAATRLRVEPLGPVEAADLAAALVPEGRLDPDTAALLAERGAGNPLHLRELVRLVRERDGLVEGAAGLRLRGGLSLPPSLHAVLTARLDALSPAERLVLQHIAVLGDMATAEALATVGPVAPEHALGQLVAAGLLRSRDRGVHDIVDPLLRDVAYEVLPRQTRAELHRRIAAIARREDDRARHLDQALGYLPDDEALRREAAAAIAASGMRLVALHRPGDAIAPLRRGVDLGLRDTATLMALANCLVDATGSPDDVLAVLDMLPADLDGEAAADRVHVAGNALSRHRPAEAIERYAEARRLWHAVGNPTKEAWAVANAAVAMTFLGRLGEASAQMTEALERFTALSDSDGVSAARQLLGLLHPDDPRVEAWMDEGLAYARRIGDPGRERYALGNLSWYHFLRARLGGPDDIGTALEHCTGVARVAVEVADTSSRLQGHALAAMLLRLAGDFDGCAEHAAHAGDLPTDPGSGMAALRDAAVFVAELLTAPDSPVPASVTAPSDTISLVAAMGAIEALQLAGRVGEARALLDEGRSRDLDAREVQLVHLGLVDAFSHLLTGDPASAASQLIATIPAAVAVSAGPSAAAARALLAEATLRGGDLEGARRLLAEVPEPLPGGVAGAILLRPAALLGEPGAHDRLAAEAARLRAPGLLLGVSASVPMGN